MTTIMAFFISTSIHFRLPPHLLEALCYVESKHDITAIHHNDGHGNSVGACQIKLKTAKHLGFQGTEKQLMNPRTNIQYAGRYLAYQLKRYKGDYTKAIIAYNRGNAKGLTYSKYYEKVINQWKEDKQWKNLK